ncbi:hypothetical protein GCM10020220_073540 [Nonomuraea rubra]
MRSPLRDSGVDVRVGLPEGSKSREKAENDGLRVLTPSEAVEEANLTMILAPDHIQRHLYARARGPEPRRGRRALLRPRPEHPLRPHRGPGGRGRLHGRPQGPGPPRPPPVRGRPRRAVSRGRREGRLGQGARPSRSPTPRASAAPAAGALRTTFKEETETDLFGEQAVLCGGVSELIKAGFETLIEAGYQPEVAYFECLHEMKLIVDLMYEGGISKMYWSVSDTAEYGGYTRGPRVINEESRQEMRRILAEVQDGTFARQLVEEFDSGQKEFQRYREELAENPIEKTGAKLRPMMSWLKA